MMLTVFTILLASAVAIEEFPALDHIKPSATPDVQKQAAQDLIERILGQDASHFKVDTVSPDIGPANRDTFIITSDGETVTISGTTGVAASMGFYHFLKSKCGCQFTWAGAQLKLPKTLPVIPSPGLKITTNDRFRYYQNVCTVSYSMAWWNWTRWEREIDWMALHGINMPLAFTGQEAIFQRVYMKMGFTKEDLAQHWGGPAFLAWARMGNMHGWGGPLPQSWIDNQLALQHQILTRIRQLGMISLLPGFAGHVPITIKKYFPNATVSRLPNWGNFNESYCCTALLDFEDPLFQQIGSALINEMKQEFGVDHLYLADSFNEETPSSHDPAYLKKAGSLLYKAMATADPDAIWVMQGWPFALSQKFWKPPQMEAFLTSVPQGKAIVLDLYADNWPQWNRTNSFYGQPFIWCMLHDFGGAMELYGKIEYINTQPFLARFRPNSTMIGIGMTPEGINQNEVIYEFMSENAIATGPRNLTQWFMDYPISRYGQYDVNAMVAWQLLLRSAYNCTDGHWNGWTNELIVFRPTLVPRPLHNWYNAEDMGVALEFMHKAATSLQNSTLFRYDLVDVARNNLQVTFIEPYQYTRQAYNNKDLTALRYRGKQLINQVKSMDQLLATDPHFLLSNWLRDSRQHGNTTQEQDLMEYNARSQITLWGPKGEIIEYAAKQWAGLVSGYYLRRWELFVQALINCITQGTTFNQTEFDERVFKEVEQPFTFGHGPYDTEPTGNTIDVVGEILSKYMPIGKMPNIIKNENLPTFSVTGN